MTRNENKSKAPSKFETKLTKFQRFVIGLCRNNKYSLSQIGKADETAVF
jgi:hypothetical protein